MIKTEEQRRWWFATHPEYSWSRKGLRASGRTPHEASGHPAADRSSYDKYEDAIDRKNRYMESLWEGDPHGRLGLEADPHTALDLAPYRGVLTSPLGTLRGLFKGRAGGYVLNAVKRPKSKGPGEWVEVPRDLGIEHQSIMSGQRIVERGGKKYIQEYQVNGIKFDDYRNGKLYEYKGRQGNLKNRDGLFPDWARLNDEARKQAEKQVEAAQGIPVIWKVGADQVKAFRKAVGDMRGITIVP